MTAPGSRSGLGVKEHTGQAQPRIQRGRLCSPYAASGPLAHAGAGNANGTINTMPGRSTGSQEANQWQVSIAPVAANGSA